MSGPPGHLCPLPPDINVRIIIQEIIIRARARARVFRVKLPPPQKSAPPPQKIAGVPPQKNAQTPRKKIRVDYYKIILIQERLTRAPARVYKAHLKGALTMYRPFYNLRVRFAQCEMSQNEVARAAGMASSTMTARMTGAQPFDAWQIEKSQRL